MTKIRDYLERASPGEIECVYCEPNFAGLAVIVNLPMPALRFGGNPSRSVRVISGPLTALGESLSRFELP